MDKSSRKKRSMKKSSNSSSSKSTKMNRIETNTMFIRKFEDYFLEKNHMICDYNMLHQIQGEKELKKLCGEHMYSNIQGNLEDEDTFKYVIVNSRKKIVAVITGYFEDGELVDICRCSKVPGGGEVLLYYVMLKYNNVHNTKHLRGYISGAIPPIEKGDSPEVEKEKKERLNKYHIDRGARVSEDSNGNREFTYSYPSILDYCDRLLNVGGLRLIEARKVPLPLSES
tara:strand:+ start:472 stop:1152 length:681 start_codon:yes stop_codon:yes gene_type:complete